MGYIRRLLAVYEEAEDLINIGSYRSGSNPEVDTAVAKRKSIEKFLVQTVEEKAPIIETLRALGKIANLKIPEKEVSQYE